MESARRTATMPWKDGGLHRVRQFLPANYTARLRVRDRGLGANPAYEIVIEGTDDHGWTMDGYVVPRLASGLMFATKIFETIDAYLDGEQAKIERGS